MVDWTGFEPASSVLSVAPSHNGDRRSPAKLPLQDTLSSGSVKFVTLLVLGLLDIRFFGGGVVGIGRVGCGGGFGLVDGGEGLDVEAFVVGVVGGGVEVEAFHEEDADAYMGFHVGGEPDFAVEVGLLEDEAG